MINQEIDTSYQVESIDLRRYLYLIWQWLWLILLAALLAAGGAYYFNQQSTPIYQAQSQLLVSDPPGANRGAASSDSIISSSLAARTYAEMLTDQPVLEQTISELQLDLSPRALKNAISVNLLGGTQILTITVEDSDPGRAMNIANKLGVVFSNRIQVLQGERYSVSKTSLESQIKQMEAQINQTSSQLETEVASLTKDRMSSMAGMLGIEPDKLTRERLDTASAELGVPVSSAEKVRLETRLAQYNAILSNLLTSYEQVRAAEAQNNATIVQVNPASTPTPPVRPITMQNTLTSLENQIKQMEAQISQTSSQLETQVASLTKDRKATAAAMLGIEPDKLTRESLATASAELGTVGGSVEKDRLDTKLTQYNGIYSNLLTSYEQVRLAEAQNNASVVQVDPASMPTVPVSPKTMQNTLIAGIVGLLLAAGGVVAFDALDDTLKDPQDLVRRTGLPIIGVIPFSEIESKGPVTRLEPRSPDSEAYRGLRTNLEYTAVTHPLKRILVTSPTPVEGKTTISTNLAIIVAQGSRSVALIDADLRRPSIQSMLDLPSSKGLTELYLKQISLGEALQSVGAENLGVIGSGTLPPNPAELLGSERMKQILNDLEVDHALVILDTPPVLSVTDSAVLIPYVDGIILVVRAGESRISTVLLAVKNLRQLGGKILGLVINGVRFNDSRYGYYYRSRYYSSYYYYTQGVDPDGKPLRPEKKTKKSSRTLDKHKADKGRKDL